MTYYEEFMATTYQSQDFEPIQFCHSLPIRAALALPEDRLAILAMALRVPLKQFKRELLEQLSNGAERLSVSDCDQFDKVRGCPGHPMDAIDLWNMEQYNKHSKSQGARTVAEPIDGVDDVHRELKEAGASLI